MENIIEWLANDGVIDAYFIAKYFVLMFSFDCIASIARTLMRGVYKD